MMKNIDTKGKGLYVQKRVKKQLLRWDVAGRKWGALWIERDR